METMPATSGSSAAAAIASAPPVPKPIIQIAPSMPSTVRKYEIATRRSSRQPAREKSPALCEIPRNANVSATMRASSATRSASPGKVRNEFGPPPGAAGKPGTMIIPGRPLCPGEGGIASHASSVPAPPSSRTSTVVMPWRGDSRGCGPPGACRDQTSRPVHSRPVQR